MQSQNDFSLDIYENIMEESLDTYTFSLIPWDRIFFFGDLGAGKSTYIRHLIRKYFRDNSLIVRSPTYTYYQKYGENVFHFDLYRLESFEDFYLIGGKDILNDRESICLIEWPEILWESVIPSKKISITTNDDGTRNIMIATHREQATE